MLQSPMCQADNPLEFRGNYSATSNNMKLAHWPLIGGLLHLVQRGGDWAGPQFIETTSIGLQNERAYVISY